MSSKNKVTQQDLVLSHLAQGFALTSAQAWDKWGITRLSSIIHRLRSGDQYFTCFDIRTIDMTVLNRQNEKTRVAKYRLDNSDQARFARRALRQEGKGLGVIE